VKQDESNGDPELTLIITWGQIGKFLKSQTKDNIENGEEYAWFIKTPYQNLMLDI